MEKCTTVKMNRKVFGFGVDDGPGPAAYDVKTTVGRTNRTVTVANEPAYTVKRRLDVGNATESPGPAYNLERLTRHGKARAPEYSMGAKLVELSDRDDHPGPAAYMPRVPEKRAKPCILLPLKQSDPRADDPGSNAYDLPSTLRRRGVTLAKKIDLAPDADSPGPAVYHAVPVNKYKNRAPNFTLAKRFKDPSLADRNDDTTPSPQAYNPTSDNKYDRSPRFSFGVRRPDKFPPLVVCGDEVKKLR